nr:hypothetical protein [Tanacetum cinerariifolium]
TVSSSNPPADQMETLTMETPIPTVSSPVPTACLNDSPKPSSEARLISKKVANKKETPSLDNILSLSNRFEDILGVTTSSDERIGVEADVSNMETSISASSTPTLRFHKDHPKSQIIGPMDTPIQTRHKSKMIEEQSFIATIHQKTDPTLLQFCLFSCFLSQVQPKKVSDALQDPSWVEAMQAELYQFKIQKVWTLVDCPKGVRPIGTNGFSRIRRMKEELLSEIRPCYGNLNPTVSSSNPPADQMETLIANQEETPSLDNILSLTHRHKSKMMEEQSFIATIHQKTDPALLQFCLYSCFLSQVEPKKVSDALQDPNWVEAMQEELLQFKIQKVWTLVDCPKGVRPIGT